MFTDQDVDLTDLKLSCREGVVPSMANAGSINQYSTVVMTREVVEMSGKKSTRTLKRHRLEVIVTLVENICRDCDPLQFRAKGQCFNMANTY